MEHKNPDVIQSPLLPETSHRKLDTETFEVEDGSFGRHLLALARVRGVGVRAIRALIEHFGTLETVWSDSPTAIGNVLSEARVPQARQLAEQIIDKRTQLLLSASRQEEEYISRGITVISREHEAYPKRLLDLEDAPYWLFVQGSLVALQRPALVAIVGTRTPTPDGLKAADVLTKAVGRAKLGVVSGLAEGIDATAHRTASRFGIPQVAVLGTGINSVFPRATASHREELIAHGGAVITEFLPDDTYGRANFVQRNRLQAALAVAVAPVEGASSSGTAHTVRFARSLKRDLFGVYVDQWDDSNQLLLQIREAKNSIYNLSERGDNARLRSFLDSLPGERWLGVKVPDNQLLTAQVRKQWKRVLIETELTDSEKVRLVRSLMEDIGLDDETMTRN